MIWRRAACPSVVVSAAGPAILNGSPTRPAPASYLAVRCGSAARCVAHDSRTLPSALQLTARRSVLAASAAEGLPARTTCPSLVPPKHRTMSRMKRVSNTSGPLPAGAHGPRLRRRFSF